MKKIIVSSISFSAVSIQVPLIIGCEANKNQSMYERLMYINGVKELLRLIDKNDSPILQPFFDENYELVTRDSDKIDFHEEAFLNITFLDEQKHAKDAFSLQFLTTFLKLTPDENKRFDLSNILLKIDRVNYFNIETKILPNSGKTVVVCTNGIANFVFENKTSKVKLENFNVPIKDAKIDIFSEMFNDKFENQHIKDENYNNFFNFDRDFVISGF